MTKVTLADVASLIDATTAETTINNNNDAIVTAVENTLSRDGTSPNQMGANLDMNSHRVINLPAPIGATEPVRLTDLTAVNGNITINAIPAGGTIGQALVKNSNTNYDVGYGNVVSSVGLSLPADFSVTGSPVTGSGTLTGNWAVAPTGTGAVVRQTSPTITSPVLSLPTIGGAGETFQGSTSGTTVLKSAATASGTLTLPAATDTLVGLATTDTLVNKTMTSPTLNTPTVASPTVTGLATKQQASDAVGQGIRQFRANGTTYTEQFMTSGGLGIAVSDSLNWQSNASGLIAALDRNGNFQTAQGVGTGQQGLSVNGSTSGATILKSTATASGTLTMPAATDTLVARNTTDTLTNKTISSASNTFQMQQLTNSLGANVALNNTANYFDGPSVAQGTSGTWYVSGTVSISDTTAGGPNYSIKLWDGTTIIANTGVTAVGTGNLASVSLSGIITNPAGNLRISVKDTSSTNGTIVATVDGTAKGSTITAIRIG